MGSIRSSSTTYSSGGPGFFSRHRQNSDYGSPENPAPVVNGVVQQGQASDKKWFYERLRRKSIQSQRMGRQGIHVQRTELISENK